MSSGLSKEQLERVANEHDFKLVIVGDGAVAKERINLTVTPDYAAPTGVLELTDRQPKKIEKVPPKPGDYEKNIRGVARRCVRKINKHKTSLPLILTFDMPIRPVNGDRESLIEQITRNVQRKIICTFIPKGDWSLAELEVTFPQ